MDLTDVEIKELKDKAQAWDIAWPALIFLDATGELDKNTSSSGLYISGKDLKRAVKFYNDSRHDE